MTNEEIHKALDQAPIDHHYTAEYLLEWFYHHQKTVIAALEAQLTKSDKNVTCGGVSNVPEGWQLVPKEPTYDMIMEMGMCCGGSYDQIKQNWHRMLAAAPQVKAETVDLEKTTWEKWSERFIKDAMDRAYIALDGPNKSDDWNFGWDSACTKAYNITRKTK